MVLTRLAGLLAGPALAVVSVSALVLAPVGAVHAQLQPPAGRLYGMVQVDGADAGDGTQIVAHVADQTCGQSAYDANRDLYIIDLDSSNATCAQMDAPCGSPLVRAPRTAPALCRSTAAPNGWTW